MLSYAELSQQLKSADVYLTAAELHGFLTGLICGGVNDRSWQALLFEFTNENIAYPTALLNEISTLYQQTYDKLADLTSFDFQLFLHDNEDDVFLRADSLSQWTNHFLLGLGLAQPKLDQQMDEIGEQIQDLQAICALTYDESDDQEELSEALEEVIEYVRTMSSVLFFHFKPSAPQNTMIH